MSDTPRTSKVVVDSEHKDSYVSLIAMTEHACQLERELNAARESLLACDERIKAEERRASGHELSRRLAEEHCKRISSERDELRQILSQAQVLVEKFNALLLPPD